MVRLRLSSGSNWHQADAVHPFRVLGRQHAHRWDLAGRSFLRSDLLLGQARNARLTPAPLCGYSAIQHSQTSRYTVQRMAVMKALIRNCLALFVLLASVAMGQKTPDELFEPAMSGNTTALAQLKTLANSGNLKAQIDLGVMYEAGIRDDSNKDEAEAAVWYRKAAEQGASGAQLMLGRLYLRGAGVPKDVVQAYMWINLAAAQGLNEMSAAARIQRDALEEDMTPAQIAEAQAMGRAIMTGKSPFTSTSPNKIIPMLRETGVYKVPVLINNAITLKFVVDSGASDVTIPSDVVSTLIRAGTITSDDFIGTQKYALADGSVVQAKAFHIKSLKVGDVVVENVTGSVADAAGDLLLGQSFLSRFKSWSIDNTRHALALQW